MNPVELEILRELDCPERSWGTWKPKKKTPGTAMPDVSGDDCEEDSDQNSMPIVRHGRPKVNKEATNHVYG